MDYDPKATNKTKNWKCVDMNSEFLKEVGNFQTSTGFFFTISKPDPRPTFEFREIPAKLKVP